MIKKTDYKQNRNFVLFTNEVFIHTFRETDFGHPSN